MSRKVAHSAGLMLVALAAVPAAAADWQEDFRGSYVDDWALPADDPISIEMGARYWYSFGSHRMEVVGDSYASDDVSHIVEAHLRIDDHSSGFYTKGIAGYSAVINNSYSTPTSAGTSQSGAIYYLGGDLGYTPFGTEDFKFGGFVGYQYWNDSPDMGRESFMTSGGGGDSRPNNLEYQMWRLGLVGRAELGDMFDITAEVAAIPYAPVGGTYGALDATVPGDVQGSAGAVSGWLYGGAAEVMARFHPAENWTIGLGGRAWYLTGQADVTFDTRDPLAPATATHWITKTTNFSTLRYGLLAELTYKF